MDISTCKTNMFVSNDKKINDVTIRMISRKVSIVLGHYFKIVMYYLLLVTATVMNGYMLFYLKVASIIIVQNISLGKNITILRNNITVAS